MLFCFQIEVNLVGEIVHGLSNLKQTHGQSAAKDCRDSPCIYTDVLCHLLTEKCNPSASKEQTAKVLRMQYEFQEQTTALI